MAVLCGMLTIQYSVLSFRLSVRLLFNSCIRRGLMTCDSIADQFSLWHFSHHSYLSYNAVGRMPVCPCVSLCVSVCMSVCVRTITLEENLDRRKIAFQKAFVRCLTLKVTQGHRNCHYSIVTPVCNNVSVAPRWGYFLSTWLPLTLKRTSYSMLCCR